MWVCAHCDSRDVHVAVRDCLHCQIFARCAFPGRGELRDRAKRRRFRGLSTSVGVDLGVEYEDVDVASRRQHVIESAVADVIGPSIAAHQPDAAADKMVDDREQITRPLIIEPKELRFQFGNAGPLRANLRLADLRCANNRLNQFRADLGRELAEQSVREADMLVCREPET